MFFCLFSVLLLPKKSMMRKRILFLLLLKCLIITASAEDSIKIKHPKFVSFQVAEGIVLPTTQIVKEKTVFPNVAAMSFKYGLHAKGDRWEDIYYGMPYKGIGLYKPFYSLSREMGHPFSVYLFQGAQWKAFSSGLSLHYEINLGVSFRWRHYDVIDHPDFLALGSSVNAHLGGNIYFKKTLSNRLDLHLGMNFLHFSNGSLRTPNYGINSMAAIVELAYKIKPEKNTVAAKKPEVSPVEAEKRFVHDISFFVTRRSLTVDTAETKLKSKYPDHQFRVAGLNYACLWRQSYRFMWGPSVEAVYDEGQKATFSVPETRNKVSGKEIVQLGKVSERFSLGLSLKGELKMPGYSIFASLGYDILSSNRSIEKRLYQIYGIKMYITEGLSASFGVKSINLTQSRYLFASLGYSF